MKLTQKLFLTIFLIIGLLLVGKNVVAAGEMIIDDFDLNPKTITNNNGSTQFQMTFRASMDVAKFNAQCGSNVDSFYWYVYQNVTGVDLKRGSGEVTVNRTASTLNFNFDQTISIDTTDPNLVSGGTAQYYGQINCPSFFSTQIARYADVNVTFGSVTNKSWACVAGNNKYACSPANLINCSDVPASAGCSSSPGSCIKIGTSLCGQDAGGGGKYSCNSSNQCVLDSSGTYITSNCDNKCGTGSGTNPDTGGTPGTTQTYSFDIPNPLKGGATDFTSLVKIIAQWIFNLAIPIAVAMIVYAGILFLTAAGEPAKVTKAKEVLTYAVIGLTIILIGSGFITLIQSILELGGTGTGTMQNPGLGLPVGPQQPTTTTNGAVGNKCSTPSNCSTGLTCKNTICQRPTGNHVGERCVAGASCDIGLSCDKSGDAIRIIDG